MIIDLDGLNGTLSNADWSDDFVAALFGIDVIYQRFFSILLSPVESFIPHKKVIIRPRDKWMTSNIRQAKQKTYGARTILPIGSRWYLDLPPSM